MIGGNTRLAAVALFVAAGGCGGEPGKLLLRSIPSPLAADAAVPERIAEARGQLAIGNTGLALEAFRRALREDPRSLAALTGIAASYDRMGRFDLARRYYEEALALAPRDAGVLSAFAASLQLHGDAAGAAQVHREIARLAAAAVPAAWPQTAAPLLPEQAAASTDKAMAVAAPSAAASVTLILPPPRPAPPAPATIQSVDQAEGVPQARPARMAETARPHLERLNMQEVALVTTGKPRLSASFLRTSPRSVTVRFAEQRQKPPAASVRLLNAARWQGLAARTRAHLADHGWRRISIGDAPQTRARSVVVYPVLHRELGQRLARQFGFATQERRSGSTIVVLLGRDVTLQDSKAHRG